MSGFISAEPFTRGKCEYWDLFTDIQYTVEYTMVMIQKLNRMGLRKKTPLREICVWQQDTI